MSTTKEKIKTILICVLVAGMLYFTAAIWFYDSPFGDMSISSLFDMPVYEDVGEGAGSDLEGYGIRPLAIVISDGTSRRGAVYSSDETDAIYTQLRENIAECMKKAKALRETDVLSWESALSGGGIFMDYRTDVSYPLLRTWLSASAGTDSVWGRYYIISTGKKNAAIYIKNSDGQTFVADTDVSSESIIYAISKISSGEVCFAADSEDDNFTAVSKETVILKTPREVPVLMPYNASANLPEDKKGAFLDVFGLGDATLSEYLEKDGTEVYVADRVTLKVSPEGTAVYTDTRDAADETLGIVVESDSEFPTLAEKTEAARALSARIASVLQSDGGIYLVSVSETANGTEVILGRHINGIPLDMKNTLWFANIRIKGKTVVSAKFNIGSYVKTQKNVAYIPEYIAAAALSGSGKSGDLNLRYQGATEGEISPRWYIGGLHKTEE